MLDITGFAMPQSAHRPTPHEIGLARDLMDSAALVRTQADLLASASRPEAAEELRRRAARYEAKADAILALARKTRDPRA